MTYEEEQNKKISTPEKEIKSCLEEYASRSNEELTIIMQQKTAWSPPHIAAKLILDERRKEDADKKHSQNIKAILRANKLSAIAIGISLLSLFVALVSYFLPYKNLQTLQEKTKTELQKPATTETPQSSSMTTTKGK
jgi:hypothetical protein